MELEGDPKAMSCVGYLNLSSCRKSSWLDDDVDVAAASPDDCCSPPPSRRTAAPPPGSLRCRTGVGVG